MNVDDSFFTALTAVAAVASGLVALTSIRDARAERKARNFVEWGRERQRAVEDLGAALLDMAAKLEEATAPGSQHAYALAKMRAEHALNLALHPDIEYTRISNVIEKPPEELTLQEFEDALHAVFESHVSVGDTYRVY